MPGTAQPAKAAMARSHGITAIAALVLASCTVLGVVAVVHSWPRTEQWICAARLEHDYREELSKFREETGAAGERPSTAAASSVAFQVFLDKKLLRLPVNGVPLLRFGDRTPFGSTFKGLTITATSSIVHAPADGKLVSSTEMKGIGHVLLIDAGSGYHVLVAGLLRSPLMRDQFVHANDSIGELWVKQEDAGPPMAYLELRKDGETIDPEPYIYDLHTRRCGK